jgi:hypothetical protein
MVLSFESSVRSLHSLDLLTVPLRLHIHIPCIRLLLDTLLPKLPTPAILRPHPIPLHPTQSPISPFLQHLTPNTSLTPQHSPWIYPPLDPRQFCIISSPERPLPVWLVSIRFIEVCARVWRQSSQLLGFGSDVGVYRRDVGGGDVRWPAGNYNEMDKSISPSRAYGEGFRGVCTVGGERGDHVS